MGFAVIADIVEMVMPQQGNYLEVDRCDSAFLVVASHLFIQLGFFGSLPPSSEEV